MKYLAAIILLSFVIFTPAYAARPIPGTVPHPQPLQPPPPFVRANFNNNVELRESGYNESSGNAGQPAGSSGSPATAAPPAAGEAGAASDDDNAWTLIIYGSLIAAASAFLWIKRKKILG